MRARLLTRLRRRPCGQRGRPGAARARRRCARTPRRRRRSGPASAAGRRRPSSERSIRRVARSLNSMASARWAARVAASVGPPRTDTSHCPAGVGDLLDRAVAGQHRGGRLGAPAGQARESRRTSRRPGPGSPGSTPGGTPNLAVHAGLVEHDPLAPVELHHPAAAHALAQVLVRRADHDLVDRRVVGRDRGRAGQGVVGLQLDHGPHPRRPCASSATSSSPNWPSSSRGPRRPTTCSRATCRCGTTRSRGRSPPRGGSRRRRACRSSDDSTPRVAATSTPSSVRWDGHAEVVRNSS